MGTSVVKVDRDSDGMKTKLNTFVKAYNDVMKTLNTAFTTTGTTKGADTLAGDSTMKQLQSQLRSLVSKVSSNGDSSMNMLSSIGITTARDGTLTLDDTKYTKAVAKDYEGVASLLAGRTDGTGLMKQISDGLTNYTKADGALKIKIDNLAAQQQGHRQADPSMQSRIDKYQETLEEQYAALEETISGLNIQGSALNNILASSNRGNHRVICRLSVPHQPSSDRVACPDHRAVLRRCHQVHQTGPCSTSKKDYAEEGRVACRAPTP